MGRFRISGQGLLSVALAVWGLVLSVPAIPQQRNLEVARTAASEQRVALIIGNAAYQQSPLRNPVNDASDIAETLKGLGFEVILRTDANRRQMVEAVRDFGQRIKRGGVGFFYYAGHGIQSSGRNFLIPVAAQLDSEADLEFESLDANQVLAQMDNAGNRVNIIVMDACRDNPFARSSRSTARGLSQMEAAKGSFLAYATSPGATAADGDGRNGIYTKHLLASLKEPDTKLEEVFKRVRLAVAKETGNKQIPWDSSSVLGDFFFKAPAPPAPAVVAVPPPAPALASPAAAPAVDPVQVELTFWDSVKSSEAAGDYEAYLEKFPKGQFAGLARSRVERLKRPATPAFDPAQVDLTFWDSIKSSDRLADFEAYLSQFPSGRFATLARLRVDRLKPSVAVPSVPAVPAPAPAVPAPVVAAIEPPKPVTPPMTTVASPEAPKLPAPVVAAAPAPVVPVAAVARPEPVLVASAAPSSTVIDAASPVNVGDSWVYEYMDGWKPDNKIQWRHTVVDVNGGEVAENIEPVGHSLAARRLRTSGDPVLQEVTFGEADFVQFAPYLTAFDSVERGRVWNYIRGMPEFGNSTRWHEVSGKVVGEETITIPAGRFQALHVRIEAARRLGSASTGEVRPVGNATIDLWYVKELKRVAKIYFESKRGGPITGAFNRDTYQLVSYRPAGAAR